MDSREYSDKEYVIWLNLTKTESLWVKTEIGR